MADVVIHRGFIPKNILFTVWFVFLTTIASKARETANAVMNLGVVLSSGTLMTMCKVIVSYSSFLNLYSG
jgi:hypothetical protein